MLLLRLPRSLHSLAMTNPFFSARSPEVLPKTARRRFGGRRRRRRDCGATWHIRPKRRGKKARRRASLLPAVVLGQASLQRLATCSKHVIKATENPHSMEWGFSCYLS